MLTLSIHLAEIPTSPQNPPELYYGMILDCDIVGLILKYLKDGKVQGSKRGGVAAFQGPAKSFLTDRITGSF